MHQTSDICASLYLIEVSVVKNFGNVGCDDAAEAGAVGHRHCRRTRTLTSTFGKIDIWVIRRTMKGSSPKSM
jgi:hypothetical protein